MPSSSLIHRILIHQPRLYARLLRWLGRGSLEKRIFLRVIRQGDIVCDVGANRGHFTALFSDLVGPCGVVHAFEPGPGTYAALETAIGDRTNCRLNRLALGETPGEMVLHQPGGDDGQASLRRHHAGSWSRAETVHEHTCRVSKLDDYASSLTRLDFIKCDVEGGELPFLRGARATLDRLSPVLFLEVYAAWTESFGYTPADLHSWLLAAHYTDIFLADQTLSRLDPDRPLTGPANLLCAKRGALPDVLET